MDIYVFENWSSDEPQQIGVLSYNQHGVRSSVSFEYCNSYLSNGKILFLDPEIQSFSGKQYSSKDLFGVFSDACPDRWGRTLMQRREVITAIKEDRSPRNLNSIDYLLGVHDEGRMGALRFSLNPEGPFLANDAGLATPPWVSLRELEEASRKIENNNDIGNEHWLQQLVAPGSSLGGARPKANVKDPDGNLWIAKFPSKHDDCNVGAWEKVTHDLAKMCGIKVPDAEIKKFSEYGSTYLSKRFDRKGEKRIHFSSAMTMIGKNDGESGSYFEMVDMIRNHSATPSKDLQELWHRLVFNMAVTNHDDHFRNHGMILNDNGLWELSPAYDMNPVYYSNALSLTVDGTSSLISDRILIENAPFFDVEKPEEELEKIVDLVSENWQKLATSQNITKSEIKLFQPAFTNLSNSLLKTQILTGRNNSQIDSAKKKNR